MDQSSQEQYDFNTEKQILDAYQQIQDQVKQKFKQLTTDTLEEMKNKMKRKQNRISQQQNINLITNQRGKIIVEMNQHVAQCWHPQCKQVKQIVLKYGYSKNQELQDRGISYICNPYISGLGFKNSECYYAEKLNQKMFQTHRLFRGM